MSVLRTRLPRPIPLRDGTTIATMQQARDFLLALPPERAGRQYWQHAARLMLDGAGADAIARQLEGALFVEGQLDLRRRQVAS